MSLQLGGIIFGGTPPGVGLGQEPVSLRPWESDILELSGSGTAGPDGSGSGVTMELHEK